MIPSTPLAHWQRLPKERVAEPYDDALLPHEAPRRQAALSVLRNLLAHELRQDHTPVLTFCVACFVAGVAS